MEYIVHHSSRVIICRLGNKDNVKLSFSLEQTKNQ